mgnify:CR=1 FL=1
MTSTVGTIHCLVSGRVQGVCFRAWTREQAHLLGIKGWVRNTRAGDVELVAQATEAALAEFQERLHEGSLYSRVTSVDCHELREPESFPDFTIRY